MSSRDPDDRDELIGELIRSAGRGPSASPEARARVYSAVQAAWRRSLAEPRSRHRRLPELRYRQSPVPWLAAAATIAAVALLVNREEAPPSQPAPVVASVERIDGPVNLVSADAERRLSPGSAGVSIEMGDSLRTGAGGRAGIRLGAGLVLRVDEESAVRFAAPEELALDAGRVYVDSGSNGIAGAFEVETSIGSVRHVGTQYEVRVAGRSVRVRVREGEVVFRDGAREVTAAAGEQVSIPDAGAPVRSALPPHDPAWDWVEGLAVLGSGEAANVAELLAWVGRETGRQLRYANPDVEAEAASLALHGVEGLTPAEVLDVIEGTTPLRYADREAELLVTTAP